MNKKIINRVLEEGMYIVKSKQTVREVAKIFNVSKSTVHKDMQQRLLEIDKKLYFEVEKIFDYHIKIRHINGGEATKQKYLRLNST